MIAPRWKKVLGDLWSNKTRTALVVMSIFIGVFAVGMITSAQAVLSEELRAIYVASNPAHATLSVSDDDSFDDDLVRTIEDLPEVGEAEGRRSFALQVQVAPNEWRDLELTAINDYEDIRIAQIAPFSGAWPPEYRQFLLERSGLGDNGIAAPIGSSITVQLPDGRDRALQLGGVITDVGDFPSTFTGTLRGYITRDTMEWLSGNRDYNQMLIRSAENGSDREHNREVAGLVYDKVQKSGRDPSFPFVPEPDQPPAEDLIGGIVLLMGFLGVLSVFLSGFLVTNTISALLAQQTKQIGIMKAVGARSSQITVMYIILVLCFGLIALAIAYPLSQITARQFSIFIAGFFNFDLVNFNPPLYVLAIQATISLIMPVVAALLPVIFGTRVTIQEALGESGASSYGRSIIDRIVQSIKGLPRPVLLSLRNTFRRKARVALTLLTLTLGGAIFIAVFSVRGSLTLTIDELLNSLFNFDVEVTFERDYRTDFVTSEALRVPGVEAVEAWKFNAVRRVNPDGSEGQNITLFAIPYDTQFIQPNILSGRWLLPDDENAVVISTGVQQNEPDLVVGSEVTLNVRGRDTQWQVVGIMPTIGGAPWAYVSQPYYEQVAKDVGTTTSIRAVTTTRTAAQQRAVAQALEEHYESLGVRVASTSNIAELRERQASVFDFIIAALLVMAVLIAFVGGLGLAGTMSLNVLERTREIGVMRAIGASDGQVLQIVMVEGVLLGSVAWALGALLSVPMSGLLAVVVGNALFTFPLSMSFSTTGLLLWLGISVILAAVASFLPAWNASRVTVRDVLAYE